MKRLSRLLGGKALAGEDRQGTDGRGRQLEGGNDGSSKPTKSTLRNESSHGVNAASSNDAQWALSSSSSGEAHNNPQASINKKKRFSFKHMRSSSSNSVKTSQPPTSSIMSPSHSATSSTTANSSDAQTTPASSVASKLSDLSYDNAPSTSMAESGQLKHDSMVVSRQTTPRADPTRPTSRLVSSVSMPAVTSASHTEITTNNVHSRNAVSPPPPLVDGGKPDVYSRSQRQREQVIDKAEQQLHVDLGAINTPLLPSAFFDKSAFRSSLDEGDTTAMPSRHARDRSNSYGTDGSEDAYGSSSVNSHQLLNNYASHTDPPAREEAGPYDDDKLPLAQFKMRPRVDSDPTATTRRPVSFYSLNQAHRTSVMSIEGNGLRQSTATIRPIPFARQSQPQSPSVSKVRQRNKSDAARAAVPLPAANAAEFERLRAEVAQLRAEQAKYRAGHGNSRLSMHGKEDSLREQIRAEEARKLRDEEEAKRKKVSRIRHVFLKLCSEILTQSLGLQQEHKRWNAARRQSGIIEMAEKEQNQRKEAERKRMSYIADLIIPSHTAPATPHQRPVSAFYQTASPSMHVTQPADARPSSMFLPQHGPQLLPAQIFQPQPNYMQPFVHPMFAQFAHQQQYASPDMQAIYQSQMAYGTGQPPILAPQASGSRNSSPGSPRISYTQQRSESPRRGFPGGDAAPSPTALSHHSNSSAPTSRTGSPANSASAGSRRSSYYVTSNQTSANQHNTVPRLEDLIRSEELHGQTRGHYTEAASKTGSARGRDRRTVSFYDTSSHGPPVSSPTLPAPQRNVLPRSASQGQVATTANPVTTANRGSRAFLGPDPIAHLRPSISASSRNSWAV